MESAALFRLLGDEERLRLIRLLLDEPAGVCVCELVDTLRLPQYQISRQLGFLRHAGLVEGEKRGTWVYYRPCLRLPPLAAAVTEVLRDHLAGGQWDEDRERFRQRLKLRRSGVCVVGYEPGRPYRECIPLTEVDGSLGVTGG